MSHLGDQSVEIEDLDVTEIEHVDGGLSRGSTTALIVLGGPLVWTGALGYYVAGLTPSNSSK
jgi:hypothetical protein